MAFLALGSFVLGGAALGQSGSGAVPPVTIDSCAPILNNSLAQPSPMPTIAGFPLASTSTGMSITFVNDSNKTADLVNFAVDSNGQRFIIRDVGTFSPGVSIAHNYRNGSGQTFVLPQFIAPHVTCHVASVRFTDGSVWRPGQPIQTLEPAGSGPMPLSVGTISVYPAHLVIDSVAESELFMVSSSKRVTAFQETDNCGGIAAVFVAATGESSATFSVKPIAPGTCTALVTDEDGDTLNYPIAVR